MTRSRYGISVGDRALINGVENYLDSMAPSAAGKPDVAEEFIFKERRTGRVTPIPEDEFLELYDQGKIRLLSPTERVEQNMLSRESFRPDDHDGDKRATKAVAKAHQRLRYTKAYDAAPVSLSHASLSAFIKTIATQHGDAHPPSAGSLRRWIRHRGAPDMRRLHEMAGRHRKGAEGSRLQPRVIEILGEEAEEYYDRIRVTPTVVWTEVTNRVNMENLHRSDQERLTRPALATVCRWLNNNMNFERCARRWGTQEAMNRFGIIKGSMTADSLLDVAIMDHTILDCWVIDEKTRQPIGRPRITLLLDSCSRMVLGFQVGWQNAGLDAALAALRHAVKTKSYVREAYPDIQYDWPAYGQPRTIVVDQGLEFMGTTFEDVCASLGISIEVAPALTPQYKGQIERVWGTLNTGLIHKLPGSVPLKPQQLREFGIDPEKTAVLFLSDLIELIHQWIITVYSREVHSELGMPPIKAWMDRKATDLIEFCPNVEALDRACARSKIVTLKREGIKLHGNLIYRSPELAVIREAAAQCSPAGAKSGQGSVRVKVTYDAEDISKIYVWNPKTGESIEVPCTKPIYTRGLSEYLHHRIREFKKADNEKFQSEAEMCANRVALARKMDEICEPLVRDRKRLQRLRHPERQAQKDLVQFDKVDSRGATSGSEMVQVTIDPIAQRDFTAPRESRPLLKAKSKSKAKRTTVKSSAKPEAFQKPRAAHLRISATNWAQAISQARKPRSGGQT